MVRVQCVFFNDTAATEIYTLSLHDALPILSMVWQRRPARGSRAAVVMPAGYQPLGMASTAVQAMARSEEHTSELQSRQYIVCRLLLEKNSIICAFLNTSMASPTSSSYYFFP